MIKATQISLRVVEVQCSMPNMTGRPGYRTMEMNGGSSVPYLARTPCVPGFLRCLIGVETEGFLDYQGRAGIISIVRWNLRPVIFGVEMRPPEALLPRNPTNPFVRHPTSWVSQVSQTQPLRVPLRELPGDPKTSQNLSGQDFHSCYRTPGPRKGF